MAETSKTVHQALLALQSLRTDGPATPTELARRLGVSRTVVLRLLATLASHEFVRRTDAGFDIGFGLLDIASALELEIRDAARPALISLVEDLRETAVLSVREGDEIVAVDQVVAAGRVVRVQYHPGSRHTLDQAAHGRAILAYVDGEIAARRDLRAIRRAGYATSRDELESGVSGLAAAVLNSAGLAVASIGVVAPTVRMPAEELLAPAVMAAAESVAEVLTTTRSPRLDPAPVGT